MTFKQFGANCDFKFNRYRFIIGNGHTKNKKQIFLLKVIYEDQATIS